MTDTNGTKKPDSKIVLVNYKGYPYVGTTFADGEPYKLYILMQQQLMDRNPIVPAD